MVHLTADTSDTLKALARSDTFIEALWRTPKKIADVAPNFGLYQVVATPVAGIPDPEQRLAALSFVVRYFEPIEDANRFRDFYVPNHPPILARFPEVRNVFCYLPLEVDLGEIPGAGLALGNEVVFENLGALNAAMSSSVMPELREDSGNFPPFGRSTHHAMTRSRHFTPL